MKPQYLQEQLTHQGKRNVGATVRKEMKILRSKGNGEATAETGIREATAETGVRRAGVGVERK
jgi:hypothetical protein